MTSLNALIVGCGSLYGKELAQQLENNGYALYGISGSDTQNTNILKVDWNTCAIQDFEKFLRRLPQLDLIVFNQNSPALIDEYTKLHSVDIIEIWKRAKRWNQSHYVNCILPTHILHTLSLTNKLTDRTCVTWMLSSSMFGNTHVAPVDYVGQKYQNYIMMKTMSLNNSQIFIGVCPGKIDDKNRIDKATILSDFLNNVDHTCSGKLFVQNEHSIAEYQPG
jgi:hypothetical protein